MENNENVLTDEQLESVSGGETVVYTQMVCSYCSVKYPKMGNLVGQGPFRCQYCHQTQLYGKYLL